MVAQTDIIITHAVGLHARPSVKFTKLAKTFKSGVEVSVNDTAAWIDAKSIVKVMGMKAPEGARLHIRADGDDAQQAVLALRDLVQRDFGESDGESGGKSGADKDVADAGSA